MMEKMVKMKSGVADHNTGFRFHPLVVAVTSAVAGAVLLSGCAGMSAKSPSEVDLARSAYLRKDFRTAAQILSEPAMKGDPDAQYALGYMYYYGEGVPKDLYRAQSWLETAAKLGHRGAGKALTLLELHSKLPKSAKQEVAEKPAVPVAQAAAPALAPAALASPAPAAETASRPTALAACADLLGPKAMAAALAADPALVARASAPVAAPETWATPVPVAATVDAPMAATAPSEPAAAQEAIAAPPSAAAPVAVVDATPSEPAAAEEAVSAIPPAGAEPPAEPVAVAAAADGQGATAVAAPAVEAEPVQPVAAAEMSVTLPQEAAVAAPATTPAEAGSAAPAQVTEGAPAAAPSQAPEVADASSLKADAVVVAPAVWPQTAFSSSGSGALATAQPVVESGAAEQPRDTTVAAQAGDKGPAASQGQAAEKAGLSRHKPARSVSRKEWRVKMPNVGPSRDGMVRVVQFAAQPRYTIHLMSSRSKADLEAFVRDYDLGAGAAYYTVTEADGVHYRLIYGGFYFLAAAREALGNLPEPLRVYKPWVNRYPIGEEVIRFEGAEDSASAEGVVL